MHSVVLVTGASRGIGRAIAERFARDGSRVALHYGKNRRLAEETSAALNAAGCETVAVQADLRSEAEIVSMVQTVLERFGKIDVLVNNAGVALPGKVLQDCSALEWDELFAVNVRGMFLTTRAVLPGMVDRRSGSIVNISSMWGITGGSCEAPYSASKAAVIGFTRALAKEVAPSRVRVNCVAPGFVTTDMTAGYDGSTVEAIRLETPLEVLESPEDVADAVAFLASEGARTITGQVLSVDGGRCI